MAAQQIDYWSACSFERRQFSSTRKYLHAAAGTAGRGVSGRLRRRSQRRSLGTGGCVTRVGNYQTPTKLSDRSVAADLGILRLEVKKKISAKFRHFHACAGWIFGTSRARMDT